MLIKETRCAVLLSAMASIAACSGGGGGGGGGNGGQPPPEDPYDPPDPPPSVEATFASIQSNVFTPICAPCHAGAAAPEGLMLNAGNSYGLLVDVESVQVPDLLRVEPGNPDDSYLIHKLEGTAAVGERMPLDSPPLSQTVVAAIRQWILEGATENGAGATGISGKPITASGASIVPNSMLESLPSRIIVMFDQDIDFSTAHREAVTLSRSGGDNVFDDDSEIVLPVASVGTSLANPRALYIELGDLPSVPDTYRLRIAGDGPHALQDIAGRRLDGNWVQNFPSGDGEQGGDLTLEFMVVGTAN